MAFRAPSRPVLSSPEAVAVGAVWQAFDISPAEPIRLGALVRQLKAPGIVLQNVSKAESEGSIQNWEKPVQDLRITVSTCRGGYPRAIRVDNGSAFILRDLDLWVYVNDVSLNLSRPGSPFDNGFILR